jgi:hypothetical protein
MGTPAESIYAGGLRGRAAREAPQYDAHPKTRPETAESSTPESWEGATRTVIHHHELAPIETP